MEAGIQVPKLCATDMVDAFGSCRLCLVEIEGRNGTPASCTTPVAPGIKIRYYEAGHILGSAQVRVEQRGQVWVVSGDYKRRRDPTCPAFEPVPCDVFISTHKMVLELVAAGRLRPGSAAPLGPTPRVTTPVPAATTAPWAMPRAPRYEVVASCAMTACAAPALRASAARASGVVSPSVSPEIPAAR